MSEAERERATAGGEPSEVLEPPGEMGERAVAMAAFCPVRLGLPPPRCSRCSSSDSVIGGEEMTDLGEAGVAWAAGDSRRRWVRWG